MLGFNEFLKEMVSNEINKGFGLKKDRKFDPNDPNNSRYKKTGESVTGEHDIYSHYNETSGRASHIWVHKKTKSLDLVVNADVKKPTSPKADPVYSNILMIGKVGKGIGHHAYYDLMRRGIVLSHENQSPGAVKVRKKLVATYPQVVYHGYDPDTKKAYPYNRGVTLNPNTYHSFKGIISPSGGLAKHLMKQKTVGFLPPKYRIKE